MLCILRQKSGIHVIHSKGRWNGDRIEPSLLLSPIVAMSTSLILALNCTMNSLARLPFLQRAMLSVERDSRVVYSASLLSWPESYAAA